MGSECAGYPDALIACPDFVLSTLALTVSDLVEEALEPFDLRLRDYRLLRLLKFDGPQLQASVGSALGVDRTTVVALVDKAEQRKLVKRTRSAADRRGYELTLTKRGSDLAATTTAVVGDLERALFAPLARDEQMQLRTLSTRLLAEPGPIASAHEPARRVTATAQTASRR